MRLAVVAVSILLVASPSFAQDAGTRAEADRQRRAEKSESLKPYEPRALEKAINFSEQRAVFLIGREGLYPKLGSLTTGSGFAYGLGFRDRDLFANQGALDIWAAASIRRYWAAEVRMLFPRLASNHLLLEGWGSRRDYPQENYFGLGPDSERADQSDYALRTNRFGGRAAVKPFSQLAVGSGLEYLQPRLGSGRNDSVPNLEDQFTSDQVPGAQQSTNFLRTSVFAEVDYRMPRNARKGGWYRVDFSHYDDRKHQLYSFNRIDADIRQFVGFLSERRVLAGRVAVSTSDVKADQTMPFYLMPTLGGNDTLRGFREYRFRGPHGILLEGEYRFEIWSAFDMALFYDAGKVTEARRDINLKDLEHDYGFGFRFNTDNGVVFRVDAAFGSSDGKHLYLVFGGVF
jgi:hypothetical protein